MNKTRIDKKQIDNDFIREHALDRSQFEKLISDKLERYKKLNSLSQSKMHKQDAHA